MAVTDYLQKSSGTCRYSYNKLKSVLYLVSEEHIKDVIIDNGEAYISGLTELPLRINGFNIQFKEETSLDERYKFQKTLTLSMHGYVNYKIFGGRYYAIVESMDGTYFMINVDFPSRITHTFNLSKDTNQTDFTFASLSNFPTLKLNAEFEAVEPVCLGLRVHGIDTLELLEREKAVLDTENKRVISTEDFKKVEFLGDSCTFQEVYDGFKVTDTITFDIALDNYKPSWQYNLLEFLDNRYASIITPKGGDNKYYPGFNFGLQPNYTIQTASQNGQSDIITVTLVEMSSYGTTAANDWSDDQDTETRWRWVKKVNDIICYECIGLGKARYLVKQEVDAFGVPTGDYQVMEGYESQYPVFHIVGTFTEQQIFDTSDCGDESSCTITSDIPATVVFTSTTCNTYSLSTTCDWEITDIPSHITVSPTSGVANSSYTVTICNTMTPTTTPVENNLLLKCCRNIRVIGTSVIQDNSCLRPSTKQINCLAQNVVFTYNGNCQIEITSIDPSLTYQVGYNTLTVQVPRNYTTSSTTWTISYKNCDCSEDVGTVTIYQEQQYEKWVEDLSYMCESGNSYHIEIKYTGTTSGDINTRTSITRKGTLIQAEDPRCGGETKWEWDNKYSCVDGDKYKLLEEFVSYDGGTTWSKTGRTQLGDLVEAASSYCEEPIEYKWELTDSWVCIGGDSPIPPAPDVRYRTTSTGYTCVGFDKYYLNEYQASYDSGETWITISSSTGSLAEANSSYCGYVPPTPPTPAFNGKFKAIYSGGTTYSADCDSSTSLKTGDTKPSGYNFSAMTNAYIGNCVNTIDYGAFFAAIELNSCSIPDSVTTIGNSAFWQCYSLTGLTIPSGATNIGPNAFRNCTVLKTINLPYGLTTIKYNLFQGCQSLINLYIPESVTTIEEWAFGDCFGLKVINIPSGVTSIGDYAFYSCHAITNISVPTGVTEINDSVFSNCYGLTGVTLPNSITTIGDSAFSNCHRLPSITIPNSVTSIGDGAFYVCKSLTGITIPDSVTTIGGYAFNECSALTSVNIGSGITSIGQGAFSNCNNLASVTINALTPPTLYNQYVFNNTPISNGTGYIYVPCESVNAYKSATYWSNYASKIFGIQPCPEQVKFKAAYNDSKTYKIACYSSTTITTAETRHSSFAYSAMTSAEIGGCVTSIGQYAFYGCTSLTSCTISFGVTTIENGAFGECYSLPSITIPNSVTSIGNSAFEYCYSLASVSIGNGVTSIGIMAFYDCSGLTSIVIPNNVTTIGESAFEYCSGLTSVNIGSGVTSIGAGAFNYCNNLASITVNALTPPTLTSGIFDNTNNCPIYVPCELVSTYKYDSGWSIYASRIQGIPPCEEPPAPTTKFYATYSGGITFSAECDSSSGLTTATTKPSGYDYSSMTSAEIGGCVIRISDGAFQNCGSLTDIVMPNSIVYIGQNAIRNCSGLTSCAISSAVTSIGNSAFVDCKSLTSVNLPSSITSFGVYAFSGCSSLTSITINAITPPSLTYTTGQDAKTFDNTNNCPIYVPSESVEKYKTTYKWTKYASRITAIPNS
ncbi:MAG: leucine-rich repeat domain-containing protein [Methanobrevibacter sp.]|nr:leucine-rich repeat domain-containing protein [Methanobrevibacter sp.]